MLGITWYKVQSSELDPHSWNHTLEVENIHVKKNSTITPVNEITHYMSTRKEKKLKRFSWMRSYNFNHQNTVIL